MMFDFPAKILSMAERGKLMIPALVIVITGIIFLSSIGGIFSGSARHIEGEEAAAPRPFSIKRVSHIPADMKDREIRSDETKEEERVFSPDEIRDHYYRYILSKVMRHKYYPPDEQKKGHEGNVILRLYIERSGAVRKVAILRQPRYRELTSAAIASIREATPFQPFPPQIPDDELIIQITMEYFLK